MPLAEIVPGILTWPWLSKNHGYNFNGYLVRDPSGNLCVDPVEPDDETLDAIVSEGVARVLLTNRNHVRAANLLRTRLGARVAIHNADVAHARAQGAEIDDELRVGERVGPFAIVAAAGKSPGEIVLHWPERRLAIVGDAVIGNPPGECSVLPEKVMDNPAQLRASVRQLLALNLDVLLVGDGVAILSGAHARLQTLVASFPPT